jgi:glutaredoxin
MVTIYTTETCPKCKILKKKLTDKNIDFKDEMDVEVLKSLGIYDVPVLNVDGTLLDFSAANSWINEQ